MNDEFVLLQSRYFAERVKKASGADRAQQIKQAYRIALSRDPTPKEMADSKQFLETQEAYHASRGTTDPQFAALGGLCNVMLNLNEFVYAP